MRSRVGSVSHPCCFRPARSIRSLTIEHPTRMRIPSDQREPRDLSSPDEDASPEERSDEGSLLSFVTPFGSCSCALFRFAYILFSTPNSLPSIGCALFCKTRGVAWVSSHFGTEHPIRMRVLRERSEPPDLSPFFAPCAPSSTNHKSRITPLEAHSYKLPRCQFLCHQSLTKPDRNDMSTNNL